MVKRAITADEVQTLLRGSAGIRCRVIDELTDGWFNAVFRVETDDGRQAVVKLAPLPGTPVLRYELGVMGTEAMFYHQAAGLDGVPMAELLYEGTDFLIISAVNGTAWAKAARHRSVADRGTLLREVGQIAARLHALPSPDGRFGCPAQQAGLSAWDWRTAFTAMVEAILDDAARWDSPIGISPAEVRQMLADGSGALGEVRQASLIHFDLWPGNIFITASPPAPGGQSRVTGIIDHERAFWGDPAAELVSLEICGPVDPDSELAAGYRDAGGRLDFTQSFRYRLALYRLYFGLILVTECGPRRYTADHVASCRARLDGWVSALREFRAVDVPCRAPKLDFGG